MYDINSIIFLDSLVTHRYTEYIFGTIKLDIFLIVGGRALYVHAVTIFEEDLYLSTKLQDEYGGQDQTFKCKDDGYDGIYLVKVLCHLMWDMTLGYRCITSNNISY